MPKGIYPRTLEHNKRLSEVLKGVPKPGAGRYPHKLHTEETKKKISLAHKGIIPKNFLLFQERGRAVVRGSKRPPSLETRRRLSELVKRGEKSNFWKGGITPIHLKIRASVEYKLWRKAIFERDNWMCIWCFKKGGKLNADHIKPFALFPELRFAIDNGRTLCLDCHRKTNTYGGCKYKTKRQKNG